MLIESFARYESTSLLFSFYLLLFPDSFLFATDDGLTTPLAFPADSRSGLFWRRSGEMPASFTSPSLKFGMTHVFLCLFHQNHTK
jgi:hypothetical protein